MSHFCLPWIRIQAWSWKQALRRIRSSSNWVEIINSPQIHNFGRGGGVVKLTRPRVSALTGRSRHSARRWKNVWGNTLHFWGVLWPDSQRGRYKSPSFLSASALWAAHLCLKDVVGVRPLKAEGHSCFMFAQSCLCRPHCIQERWGSMWSLTCPELIMFHHPFLLFGAICTQLRHILQTLSSSPLTI